MYKYTCMTRYIVMFIKISLEIIKVIKFFFYKIPRDETFFIFLEKSRYFGKKNKLYLIILEKL